MAQIQAASRRGLWYLTGIVVFFGIAACFAIFKRPQEVRPTLTQVMAREANRPAEIVVGPNIQVSGENGTFAHREVSIVADPIDPQRLFATAILHPYANQNIAAVSGYRSEDGGTTWQACSFPRKTTDELQFDQDATFGPDGELNCVFRTLPEVEVQPIATRFRFFRSTDLGRSWEAMGTVEGGQELDRPYLAVDCTSGPFRGHLYCASALQLHVSTDDGKTFTGHRYKAPQYSVAPQPSNPVVFSDGAVVFSFLDWRQDFWERTGLGSFASDDGGRSIRELPPLETRWQDESCHVGHFWYLPGLAVGAVDGPYRDRLYAVWDDGNGPLRVRTLFAYSDDKGQTWTGPTILSEQPTEGSAGYSANMPEVAVNKDGIVAVSWYDRRGLPDVQGERFPEYGVGCNLRLRLSLDGGDTWQPSLQINDKPIQAMVHDLRDHHGLTADSTGLFHPTWIDDRTGERQIWTATVRVDEAPATPRLTSPRSRGD